MQRLYLFDALIAKGPALGRHPNKKRRPVKAAFFISIRQII